jgi:pyruvate ferredoxin oxidoreductase gamma subunit
MKEKEIIEVRFHSRGGQGGVTAAKLLAIAAFVEGKYSSSFAIYGAERRGAATLSFTRISQREIKVYSQIAHPDCVVIIDPSLVETENEKEEFSSLVSSSIQPKEGLKAGGKVAINSATNMVNGFEQYDTYVVDATRIALDLGLKVAGAPVLNVPVLGVIAKMGIVNLDSVKTAVSMMFSDVRNIKAAEMAYNAARRVNKNNGN